MFKNNKMYLIWNDKIPPMVSIADRLDFFSQKEKHSIETQYVSVLPTNDWYVCKEKMFARPCPLIKLQISVIKIFSVFSLKFQMDW